MPRASVAAREMLREFAWAKVELRAHLVDEPEVRAAFQQAIGADLCAELGSGDEAG